MAEDREIFPRRLKDRRELPNVPSPDRRGDRRRHPRYEANLDVTVSLGKGSNRRTFHAKARDISDGGIFLENIDIPAGDPDVEVNFIVPPGTLREGYEAPFRLGAKPVRFDPKQKVATLQFRESLESVLRRRRWLALSILAALLAGLTLAVIAVIKEESVFYFWFDVPIFLYGLCAAGYLVSRFLFASFYSSYEPTPGQEFTPSVSIVIPCFDEEEWIERTVTQCLDQDYPPDRLQVIVVNDGSTDSSAAVLERLKERYERLAFVDLSQNVGKRKALSVGVQMAKGDFITFVDSDSFLEPNAIRNVVLPFSDPHVAGVSGHCEVENKWTNFLTRMQAVRYFIGFRVMKAAESVFDAVTCLSGPLSCYRKTKLLSVVDAWVDQHYLGRPATFGDDRSLTNFLLRRNKLVYQSTAVCRTIVPSTYRLFMRQQMRWKRSWLRESFRASVFMWRKQPFMAVSFYLGVILPVLAPIVAFRALVWLPVFYSTAPFIYLFGIVLMSSLMSSTYLFAKRSHLWIYGVPFCFFYLFVLLWQMPLAMATFWESRWGTRGPSAAV